MVPPIDNRCQRLFFPEDNDAAASLDIVGGGW
jgi:hypothetical protein